MLPCMPPLTSMLPPPLFVTCCTLGCFPMRSAMPLCPPCSDCKCLDTPDERRFDNITTLLKDMFQVGAGALMGSGVA